METTRRTFQVDRRQIHYIRSTLESYDGMALVRTLDPRSAVVEVRTPKGCEDQLLDLVQDLRDQEGITMTPVPWKQDSEERPEGAESEFPRTFSIVTMGCQMNEYDSEYAFRILENAGFSFVMDPEQADIVVINTCRRESQGRTQSPEHPGTPGQNQEEEGLTGHSRLRRLCSPAGGRSSPGPFPPNWTWCWARGRSIESPHWSAR